MIHTSIDSPLGELLLLGDGSVLRGLYMQQGPHPFAVHPGWKRARVGFEGVVAQLEQYFAGDRIAFDLPLAMVGSPFQLGVWEALKAIPYGATISYGELAERVGSPAAQRAVGRANGSNPISIIIPCHRVIGASGALTGYGAGIERKRWLLELETGVARLAL